MSFRFFNSSCLLENVYIQNCGLTAGIKEAQGPLGTLFDKTYDDYYCGEVSFEKGERKMLEDALHICLQKENLTNQDIDLYIGSDLLNQNTTIHYLMRNIYKPIFSVYGACSGFALTHLLAALLIEGQFVNQVIALLSSHNATAERQFRFPIEYGIQKKETTTYTATGACATLLSSKKSDVRVEALTIGKVIDYKQNNPNDMGRAMAPAAYDTIMTHFKDLNRSFEDYDFILTGDLSEYGHQLLKEMFAAHDFYPTNYQDCGCLLYDKDNQDVFQGGSGCACSALVTMSTFYQKLKKKELKRILIVSTGALLSPMMTFQKESIPSIAHAISLEGVE